MTARAAGLLLHPSSLPGRFGIGDLGPAAERFLDWAQSAGQTLWQVLPLSPVGHGNSPYSGLSAFAGSPLLISPERLCEEGLLPELTLEEEAVPPSREVEFASVATRKEKLLRVSWEHFLQEGSANLRCDFEAFRTDSWQTGWLADWGLFAALKRRHQSCWTSWPEGLARRWPDALAVARRELADEIAYQQYLQFLFFRQWARLKTEANRRGIAIMGDLPISVAHDSTEVWAHPDLFALADDGRPALVAGVPPDYFSPSGQLWGYPLYRWARMEEDGYAWWIDRIRMNLRTYDLVRLDHFRGFVASWAVAAGEKTAIGGKWIPGPGAKFFDAVFRAVPRAPLVAEDLGTITGDVQELLACLGMPGMRVLQFAFSEDDSEHLPHRHIRNGVIYTGTHDNDTTRGWFVGLGQAERDRVLHYLGGEDTAIQWDLIRAAYGSVADRAIVPLQDVFGLGSEARMNTPGRAEGNWGFRAQEEDFGPEPAARLRRLAELTGRWPAPESPSEKKA